MVSVAERTTGPCLDARDSGNCLADNGLTWLKTLVEEKTGFRRQKTGLVKSVGRSVVGQSLGGVGKRTIRNDVGRMFFSQAARLGEAEAEANKRLCQTCIKIRSIETEEGREKEERKTERMGRKKSESFCHGSLLGMLATSQVIHPFIPRATLNDVGRMRGTFDNCYYLFSRCFLEAFRFRQSSHSRPFRRFHPRHLSSSSSGNRLLLPPLISLV